MLLKNPPNTYKNVYAFLVQNILRNICNFIFLES